MNKLPKDYIVYAKTIEEAEEITQHQKLLFGENNPKQKQTWYRFEPKNIFDRFGRTGDSRWYPSSKPHLPIYTFKEWKELMTETVSFSFKYTIEYCKNNKVAIKLDNYTQLREANKLFKNDRIPSAKYFPIEQRFDSKGCNWSYASDNYYKPENYEIIEFGQLNLKTQENMKKIIGYKLIKRIPGFSVGAEFLIDGNGEWACDELSYTNDEIKDTEFFTPIYAPEFKEGDWVLLKGDNTGNGTCGKEVIIKLLKIDENKNPTGNLKSDSHFMVFFKEDYYRTNKAHIIRKATEEEIKQATNVEINGYKCVKTEEGVEFGCQKFSEEELATILRLVSSPVNARITINGTKITKELLNKIMY